MDTGRVHVVPIGPSALLVEVDDVAQALDLAAWVRATVPDVVEVVPAARTVLLDGVAEPDGVRRLLLAWTPGTTEPSTVEVELPTTYDGPDFAAVADAWGTDTAGVVARHQDTVFTAAFCGFAPGFAYLTGLPEALAVPRLTTPRTRVPAGSVALAGPWCGVYPTASPGGWQLVGRTDAVLWDVERDPPALLAPGTRVRFVAR